MIVVWIIVCLQKYQEALTALELTLMQRKTYKLLEQDFHSVVSLMHTRYKTMKAQKATDWLKVCLQARRRFSYFLRLTCGNFNGTLVK